MVQSAVKTYYMNSVKCLEISDSLLEESCCNKRRKSPGQETESPNTGITHAHLGPTWYHSDPSDVHYSPFMVPSAHNINSFPTLRRRCL